ncbi:MAG: nuclease-related domain-containing protein [Actinobacteria bacterium]|nr:nuclease-related domain-containing protein [Actinomycetota bacterium]
MGGLLLAIVGESASTTAFRIGAEGERKAAERILGRCGPEVGFLLNRRLGPGRRDGDVDMIAITAAGVHVIDIKHYKGAKVEVRTSGGLFSPRAERLFIGGRDRTSLLDSMDRQCEAVRLALATIEGGITAEVFPSLCFVDGDLPVFSTPSIGGVVIRGSREVGRRLRKENGPLSEVERLAIAVHLGEWLPPA